MVLLIMKSCYEERVAKILALLLLISSVSSAMVFLYSSTISSTARTSTKELSAEIKSPEIKYPSQNPTANHTNPKLEAAKLPIFRCPPTNETIVCAANDLPHKLQNKLSSTQPACPDYFRWIHEDLRPWKNTGISLDMVEAARRTATFRLIIVNGKVYVERYGKSYQSRDDFTLWGILQLLRKYPGQLPDLDLMFDCVDYPVIKASRYRRRRNGNIPPAVPPLFRYCGDDETLDIVFPDWSFWGWAEIGIKPWGIMLEELKKGNEKIKWSERQPYAYWKGNPAVAMIRQELLKCNVSETQNWNARIYAQDWLAEGKQGFKDSNVANQCNYRYKIYIEGSAWSVSEKYILACDSLALIVTPRYYDFFTRELMPVQHYWPIQIKDKCPSIKFAVEWGNTHKQKVQSIGKETSSFIQEKLKMDYVYDYMFHLLLGYAKLLKYKPSIPANAAELCLETMACPANGLAKKFMMESMVSVPADGGPCSLPEPFNPSILKSQLRRKFNSIKQVEMWQNRSRPT